MCFEDLEVLTTRKYRSIRGKHVESPNSRFARNHNQREVMHASAGSDQGLRQY